MRGLEGGSLFKATRPLCSCAEMARGLPPAEEACAEPVSDQSPLLDFSTPRTRPGSGQPGTTTAPRRSKEQTSPCPPLNAQTPILSDDDDKCFVQQSSKEPLRTLFELVGCGGEVNKVKVARLTAIINSAKVKGARSHFNSARRKAQKGFACMAVHTPLIESQESVRKA